VPVADHALVTGGAGFIGSHLVDALLADGGRVTVYDDFRTGQAEFLADAASHPRCRVIEGDVLDRPALVRALAGCDTVFHLQASADVRFGFEQPDRDLEQNTVATFTVLEAMRAAGVRRIAFTSTGSIYGEPDVFPTAEDCPFPRQTSLYGAAKLAGEGMIQAYGEGYGFEAVILRLVSTLGPRLTHGHLFDFYRALSVDPTVLHVLGDGQQRKSYLAVGDVTRAIVTAIDARRSPGAVVYNVGNDETSIVRQSVAWVCDHLGITPQVTYRGGERGWVGDSPRILLDSSRLRALGWAPTQTIEEAVRSTLRWFDANPWIFQRRTAR